MSRSRSSAVATTLIMASLATAGCGLGAGKDVGSVELTVTRDFGAAPMVRSSVEATESSTVMRVLEGEAEISTRYGGGYVESIDGVAEEQRQGEPYDWFFFVDGVESPVGAAEFDLRGGERIWWDHRDWIATSHVPAVVGSWPAPFLDGYEGKRHPVVVVCEGGGGACGVVEAKLEAEGVELAGGEPDGAIRFLVGPWAQLRTDPAAATIEDGPATSGVYADFEQGAGGQGVGGGFGLVGLDAEGDPATDFGPAAGLIAATRRYEAPPTWVLTGGTRAAVQAAAAALDAETLRDHYAVAVRSQKALPLPVGGEPGEAR
jgi:Domain of unknown function (DUF4430)